MPGLVNAHGHAPMSLFRGLADDMPLERWLRERIWPAESRWVGPELVADGTRLAVAEMLAGGITCFSDMYFYPDVVGEVAAEAGMRAVLGMIALDVPTAWAADADEYLRKGLELHDRLRSEPLLTAAFAPHAPYTVKDATLSRIRLLADELEVPIHMHVHETAAEVAEAVAATGRRPLAAARGTRSRDARVDRRACNAARSRRDRHAGERRREHRALSALEPEARERCVPGRRAAESGRQRRARDGWRGEQQPARPLGRDANRGARRQTRGRRRDRRCGDRSACDGDDQRRARVESRRRNRLACCLAKRPT